MTEEERIMLQAVRKEFAGHQELVESTDKGFLNVRIQNHHTGNHLDLSYDNHLLVLGIGDWCHDHPQDVPDAIEMIKKITEDKVVIWKVTRPSGHWYSGTYDIEEWKANPNLVDEPDSGIESGDRIERSTFSRVLEDRVVGNEGLHNQAL